MNHHEPDVFTCYKCQRKLSTIYRQYDWTVENICFECFLENRNTYLNQQVRSVKGQAFLMIYNGYSTQETAVKLAISSEQARIYACEVGEQLLKADSHKTWHFAIRNGQVVRCVARNIDFVNNRGEKEREILAGGDFAHGPIRKAVTRADLAYWRKRRKLDRTLFRHRRFIDDEPADYRLGNIETAVAELTG